MSDTPAPEYRFPPPTEIVPIDSVIPDPANARTHGRRNLEAIRASLRELGQYAPIVVDANGVIRAGNGLHQVMREEGWSHIGIGRVRDYSPTQLARLALWDNRTAELAEWDYEVVAQQLATLQAEGVDPTTLGWDTGDLQNLLAAEWAPPAVEGSLEAPAHPAPPIKVTVEQRAVIERAMAVVRADVDDDTVSEGRCLELICADWLQSDGRLERVPIDGAPDDTDDEDQAVALAMRDE